MCGIIGLTSEKQFTSQEVLTLLKKLDYRGYDSFGYATPSLLYKEVGEVNIFDDNTFVNQAIAHTRWATHGGVTELNAHPHKVGKITLVHNGIIENYQELKNFLINQGYNFNSQTDSEVVAALADNLFSEMSPEEALPKLIKQLQGSYAIVMMVEGKRGLYALKKDSPLVLGIGNNLCVSSDPHALPSEQMIFFENGDYAIIDENNYQFFNNYVPIIKKVEIFSKITDDSEINEGHFMLKEIREQPKMALNLLDSLSFTQLQKFEELIKKIKDYNVIFVASGTAYHASLLGAYFLHTQGIKAQALIAGEFDTFATINENDLVIAVSQSGETMDVIEALKYAKENNSLIASIVNVPFSSIERASDLSIRTEAGKEVAVASTKAFTNQVITMLNIAKAFGYPNGLNDMPNKLKKVLSLEPIIANYAKEFSNKNDLYVIGRKIGYPVSREIALKIKEISYVHAEGMMASELKHGTIALIENGTPVIALSYENDVRMNGSIQEVIARGANVVTIGTKNSDIIVPADSEAEFGILSAVVGQLLAYYLAFERGCNIDKPRNLAKSVTVL